MNELKESLSVIQNYLCRFDEEYLKNNIRGYIYKGIVRYRDPDRNWYAKDFCPQLDISKQNLLTEDTIHHFYIKSTKIQDKYVEDLLDCYRIRTKDEPYNEEIDNSRLSAYIDTWRKEIPLHYDKKEHLKRLIWDVTNYFNISNEHRNEVDAMFNELFPNERDLQLNEFQSNGMIFKVVDFRNRIVELKAIRGLWGEYTRYCKANPVIPNSKIVKIPKEVFSPCCNAFIVRYLGKGLFDNLTETETLVLPVSIEKCAWSFWNCKKLQSIEIDGDGGELRTYNGVLYDKEMKILIAYPNCHGSEFSVPNGVEIIGNCSFKDCNNIRMIHLPNTIKRIGLNAFYRCYNLEKIVCDFGENDFEFEGFYGDHGDFHPHWIFKNI